MSGKGWVLDEKARKELCCRLPRLLRDGKTASARRLLEKHEASEDSPLLHASSIMVAEASGDREGAQRLLQGIEDTLDRAAGRGADEVRDCFLRLFAFYVSDGLLDKAEAVFDLGRRYGVGRAEYGMLWVRYCDRAGRCREGLESMETYFTGKKRLSKREIGVLRSQYPALARSAGFDRIFRG
jgi:hypothetical protein